MIHLNKLQLLTLLLVVAFLALPMKGSTPIDASPDDGYISNGSYFNKFFDFTYKPPQGLTPQSRVPHVCAFSAQTWDSTVVAILGSIDRLTFPKFSGRDSNPRS